MLDHFSGPATAGSSAPEGVTKAPKATHRRTQAISCRIMRGKWQPVGLPNQYSHKV